MHNFYIYARQYASMQARLVKVGQNRNLAVNTENGSNQA